MPPAVEEPLPVETEKQGAEEPVASEPAPLPLGTAETEVDEIQPDPITPPRADAGHLNNPAPVYPRTSLRLHEEGKVILTLLIRADGTVDEVTVKVSSGHPSLDKAALKAVKRWRYLPATQGGQAIDYRYEQPILFSLRK